MNALTSWNRRAQALKEAVAARPSPEAAQAEFLHTLDAVRAETMAAQPDEFLRQEAGLLFDQARQAALFLQAVDFSLPTGGAPKGTALSVAGVAAGFLACASALLEGAFFAAAFALLASLALLLPLLRGRAAGREAPRAAVRPERLVRMGELLAQRIDGYLDDLRALNGQIAGQANARTDPKALSLCQDLWENRADGPNAANLIVDESIEYLLTRNGCEMRLYDAAHAHAFLTLPSRNESRTIRPAIYERGTQTVLLRGLAAVREEGA